MKTFFQFCEDIDQYVENAPPTSFKGVGQYGSDWRRAYADKDRLIDGGNNYHDVVMYLHKVWGGVKFMLNKLTDKNMSILYSSGLINYLEYVEKMINKAFSLRSGNAINAAIAKKQDPRAMQLHELSGYIDGFMKKLEQAIDPQNGILSGMSEDVTKVQTGLKQIRAYLNKMGLNNIIQDYLSSSKNSPRNADYDPPPTF